MQSMFFPILNNEVCMQPVEIISEVKFQKTCFKAYLWKFFLSFRSLWHAFKISYTTTHIISSGLVSILDNKQQKHR